MKRVHLVVMSRVSTAQRQSVRPTWPRHYRSKACLKSTGLEAVTIPCRKCGNQYDVEYFKSHKCGDERKPRGRPRKAEPNRKNPNLEDLEVIISQQGEIIRNLEENRNVTIQINVNNGTINHNYNVVTTEALAASAGRTNFRHLVQGGGAIGALVAGSVPEGTIVCTDTARKTFRYSTNGSDVTIDKGGKGLLTMACEAYHGDAQRSYDLALDNLNSDDTDLARAAKTVAGIASGKSGNSGAISRAIVRAVAEATAGYKLVPAVKIEKCRKKYHSWIVGEDGTQTGELTDTEFSDTTSQV